MNDLSEYQINLLLLDTVLLTILLPSLYYDLRHNKIPNFLTVSGMVFGILMALIFGAADQVRGHLFGLVLGFGLFYIFYLFGWVGGGDVKLMGAIGALKGVTFLVNVIIYTSVFGGIIAVIFLILSLVKKYSLKTLQIPYGTAICLGTFISLAIQYGLIGSI